MLPTVKPVVKPTTQNHGKPTIEKTKRGYFSIKKNIDRTIKKRYKILLGLGMNLTEKNIVSIVQEEEQLNVKQYLSFLETVK